MTEKNNTASCLQLRNETKLNLHQSVSLMLTSMFWKPRGFFWQNHDLIGKEKSKFVSVDSSNFVVQENNFFSVFCNRGSFCHVLERGQKVKESFIEGLVRNVFSKDI